MLRGAIFRPPLLGALLLAASLTPGCDAPAEGSAPTLVITLAPAEFTLQEGAMRRIDADVRDQSGTAHPEIPLTWSASGIQAATVDSGGIVVAHAPGTAVISAMTGGARGSATVTVTPFVVDEVQLRPNAPILTLGGAVRLEAMARDSTGAVVTELPVAWSSDDPTIAVVDTGGLVRTRHTGATAIRATIAGVTGTDSITVSGATPGVATWPNEPAGFSLVSDQPWDSVGSLGWTEQFGAASITADLLAPRSPPGVLTITYPAGFAGGSAPATAARAFASTRAVFTGIWWKVSEPWQGHTSNVNKVLFLFPEGGGDITMVMYGPPGGPYELRVIPQFPGLPSNWLHPNVEDRPVTLGEWHRVEWLVDYSSGAGVGAVRWWLDGHLIGDHRRVPFPDGGMREVKISPTWGGVGDTKQSTDHFWFDHTYLSTH